MVNSLTKVVLRVQKRVWWHAVVCGGIVQQCAVVCGGGMTWQHAVAYGVAKSCEAHCLPGKQCECGCQCECEARVRNGFQATALIMGESLWVRA